jgi:hypothetical protein
MGVGVGVGTGVAVGAGVSVAVVVPVGVGVGLGPMPPIGGWLAAGAAITAASAPTLASPSTATAAIATIDRRVMVVSPQDALLDAPGRPRPVASAWRRIQDVSFLSLRDGSRLASERDSR